MSLIAMYLSAGLIFKYLFICTFICTFRLPFWFEISFLALAAGLLCYLGLLLRFVFIVHFAAKLISNLWKMNTELNWTTFDVQDADFPEAAAGSEQSVLCDPIVGHHCQLSLLNDIHLLPYVSFPADVVSRTEDLRPQLEHQLHQQSCLAVLKNPNFLQSLQMNVDGDLGAQLVG